jgi:hypothetical protein
MDDSGQMSPCHGEIQSFRRPPFRRRPRHEDRRIERQYRLGNATIKALLLAVAVGFGCVPGPVDARIQRSAAEVLAFKRANPCPSTGLRRGACPDFQVDHVMPLCAGGADKTENMQWLSVSDHRVKTRGDVRVCRYLRKIPNDSLN